MFQIEQFSSREQGHSRAGIPIKQCKISISNIELKVSGGARPLPHARACEHIVQSDKRRYVYALWYNGGPAGGAKTR